MWGPQCSPAGSATLVIPHMSCETTGWGGLLGRCPHGGRGTRSPTSPPPPCRCPREGLVGRPSRQLRVRGRRADRAWAQLRGLGQGRGWTPPPGRQCQGSTVGQQPHPHPRAACGGKPEGRKRVGRPRPSFLLAPRPSGGKGAAPPGTLVFAAIKWRAELFLRRWLLEETGKLGEGRRGAQGELPPSAP